MKYDPVNDTFLHALIDGVLLLDEKGKIIICNDTAKKYFFLSHSILDNQYVHSIKDFYRVSKIFKKTRVSKKSQKGEFVIFYHDQQRIISYSSSYVHKKSMILMIFYDVTRLKKLDKIRQEFVANISHELKTPLTSIKGYTESLLDWALIDPKKNKTFLQKIYNNVEKLCDLVQDILSLSKIESEEIVVSLKPVSWLPVVQEIVSRYDEDISRKKIKINIDIAKDFYVLGEKQSMEMILDNLLNNAIRYTYDHSQIKLTLYEEKNFGVIEVLDTGKGIPAKDLERIFERFYRVEKDRSRKLGGTGLGLSIVKHLVSRLSGEINVTSILGSGSCFKIYLRLSKKKHHYTGVEF